MVSGLATFAGLLVLVVLTAVALRFYLPLARRVLVQRLGMVEDDWVRAVDVLVAVLLATWFALLGRDALTATGDRNVEFGHVVSGAVIYAAILLFIFGLLIYRNVAPSVVFGWRGSSFGWCLGQALLCLAAAYPLLLLVQAMVFGATGGDASPQDVVQFLQEAEAPRDRLGVVVMAVAVAPLAEEIIFRGYLYTVAKRYIGVVPAMVSTSLLFAAVHGHAESIPALFVLAMCLGLAYERSGSLLVPMIMHAIFNTVSVAAILFLL